MYIFFVLLKAQDDYISQLHVKFNEIQQYAVSTEEVRNARLACMAPAFATGDKVRLSLSGPSGQSLSRFL